MGGGLEFRGGCGGREFRGGEERSLGGGEGREFRLAEEESYGGASISMEASIMIGDINVLIGGDA